MGQPSAVHAASRCAPKPDVRVRANQKGERMADRRYGGISLGGIIVVVGIILIIVWSFWIGLIVTLIGLIAFGGFARGKWY
jgi:hypothetical protein